MRTAIKSLIFLVVGLVLTVPIGCKKEKSEEAQKPQYSVTAEKLSEEYHANAIAAGNQYGGRRLGVKGVIAEVFTGRHIKLQGREGAEVPDVWCIPSKNDKKEIAKLKKLKKGQTVILKGRITRSITFVTLEECEVLYSDKNFKEEKKEVKPEVPDYSVSAKELVENYSASGQFGTDRRYTGKLVEVTGVITSVAKDIATGHPYVALEGVKGKGTIKCTIKNNKKGLNKISKLRRGQRVKMRGKVNAKVMTVIHFVDCVIQ